MQALQDLETLDPTTDAESRAKFLENFDWKDSTLTPEEKKKIEELLVEFHDIFARHRFDIGMNEEFKVKLTPNDDSPAYSQSLPAPINLKEDILVELAMLHKYGIITTLPFSKYASPIFAQKKPNGKLRLLIDLRKINNLISDDYINNNHPVSTLVDAAQHLAGKKLFCKLDCSQAYHCLPMADQRSIEMLAFNFASRTFAYRRLAQGLSRSLSAFSSFMREYLDKVIKADQCAQYVDDIGIAANDVDHLMTNLRATFKCIQEAGLKLTIQVRLRKTNQIIIEQSKDAVLQQLKAKLLHEEYSENLLHQDARYRHYANNLERIVLKDESLGRQYFDETGNVKYHQILLPQHLLQELLQSLHGTAHKHSGISKMLQEDRQRYYYPSMAKHVKKWVEGREQCARDKRVPNATITPELLNLPDWDLGPEDAMQIDLLPNLPPSGGYENVLTAIDVFSRYLFAYPLTDSSAINVAKAIIDIMTKHAYLPTTLITDKGTAFTSTIIAEVTQILSITLKCATTKHPQTIGKLERTHASLKTNLKMACGEYRRQWHKYLPLAVLNHNTSYHTSIGCEPTRVFHGRIPYNILDHKLGNNPNEKINPTTEFAEEIQNRTKILIDKTKQNIMQSYIKYKEYYDRKAKAAPLKENEYCFVLQPKADNQGSKIPFRDYRWVGPFVVQKILPNENYIVRRSIRTKLKFCIAFVLRSLSPINRLRIVSENNSCSQMKKLSFRKMIYTS